MNIAVYCGATKGDDPAYARTAHAFGRWMGESGHVLVYGGGNIGLMDEVSRGVLDAGGHVIGVLPDVKRIKEGGHPELPEYVFTDTVSQRKDAMIARADAFVALPGGIGTIDELSDVLALKKAGAIDKPCLALDVNGFYGPFKALLAHMEATGFLAHDEASIAFPTTLDEAIALLEK